MEYEMAILKKNEIHTVTITGYSSDGSGVARIDGLVVFVKGALEGEECRIKLLKVLKNIAYAKIEEMIKPSEHRIAPACPVFGKCGGCDFMHMDYEEELKFKLKKVSDAVSRIGGTATPVAKIHGAEKQELYRNKAIYAVSRKDDKAVTGFYRERTHDVMEIDSCLIQAEFSARVSAAVREWMDESGAPEYNEKTGKGCVRHVFCRYAFGTGKGQAAIVCAYKNLPEKNALIAKIREKCPECTGIILNVNKNPGNTVLAGDFYTLWGEEYLEDTLCGHTFRFSPLSFYQVNRDQAEKLYSLALEFASLTGNETVLELYCGTGTITLSLAAGAKKVIGAEIVPQAIENAKDNAERNGIENAEFICADASDIAQKLSAQGLKPEIVVVDPPRKGLSPEVPTAIAEMAPSKVVYVSCDPATLARDIKVFASLGYEAQRIEAVDMFPRTVHVETVCLLERK